MSPPEWPSAPPSAVAESHLRLVVAESRSDRFGAWVDSHPYQFFGLALLVGSTVGILIAAASA